MFLFIVNVSQALTYRVGHHSTSGDSTKYRPFDKIEHWRTARDPAFRYRKWAERNGWWSDAAESEMRNNVRKEVPRYNFVLKFIFHGLVKNFAAR